MRDIIAALLLTAALVAVVSTMECPAVDLSTGAGWPQRPGASGPILPGDGMEQAEYSAPAPTAPPRQPDPATETEQTEKTATCTEERALAEKPKEEKMDIIIAYWHGVATVLLGEVAALLVAATVLRIKGAKNGAD